MTPTDPLPATIPRLLLEAGARRSGKLAIEDGPVSLGYAALAESMLEAARAFSKVPSPCSTWEPYAPPPGSSSAS